MSAPVVHFEIHADDTARALKFYKGAFGWARLAVPEMGDHWLLCPEDAVPEDPMEAHGEGIAGGMTRRRRPRPGADAPVHGHVCVLEVKDLDASYGKVKKHGGTTALEPLAIEGVGRVFYAKDTEGNIFGEMQPE